VRRSPDGGYSREEAAGSTAGSTGTRTPRTRTATTTTADNEVLDDAICRKIKGRAPHARVAVHHIVSDEGNRVATLCN
jgi:hypothetical protein